MSCENPTLISVPSINERILIETTIDQATKLLVTMKFVWKRHKPKIIFKVFYLCGLNNKVRKAMIADAYDKLFMRYREFMIYKNIDIITKAICPHHLNLYVKTLKEITNRQITGKKNPNENE